TQYSPVRARECLEEALGIFEGEGMLAERADALAGLVRAVLATDPDDAERVARLALDAATAAADPRLRAGALTQIGQLALHREDALAAIESLTEATALAEEIGDMATLGRAQLMSGHAHALTGELESADRYFDAAMDTAERTGAQMAWLYGAMARVEHWEGRQRFARILEWLEGILPELTARGHRHHLSYVHYAMGYRALRWLGLPAEALEHLDVAAELTRGDDWNPPAVMFRNGRAALLLDLGRTPDARAAIDEARRIAEEHRLQEATMHYLLVTEARVALTEGDLERAGNDIARLDGICRDRGEGHAASALNAELALEAGDPSAAIEAARRAVGLEPLIGVNRWFSRLQVLELLARAEVAAGEDPSATLATARGEAEARLAEIPDRYRAGFLSRPEVQAVLSG
ncbi:MAG TPA: hypothetical protein VE646_02505, partial [Actinomycetota bacterium]|nr:hypothetical protein [Actinomycetota bacterium]